MQRYSESELISNRSAVLLFGGTAAERRAWAEEAARHFDTEGELVWVQAAAELLGALARRDGVVAVEDVSSLDHATQGQILHCLMRQEERPKLVLGLKVAADTALANGILRDDLHYRLSVARVDLSAEEVKASMRARTAKREAKAVSRASAPKRAAQKPILKAKPAANKARPRKR